MYPLLKTLYQGDRIVLNKEEQTNGLTGIGGIQSPFGHTFNDTGRPNRAASFNIFLQELHWDRPQSIP